MKSILMAAVVATSVLAAGVARADEDQLKEAGCLKCHAMDKKKNGPAFQAVAEKYKGKADAPEKLFAKVTGGPPGHKAIKASDDQVKEALKFILAQ
jgi:cytochrome c